MIALISDSNDQFVGNDITDQCIGNTNPDECMESYCIMKMKIVKSVLLSNTIKRL